MRFRLGTLAAAATLALVLGSGPVAAVANPVDTAPGAREAATITANPFFPDDTTTNITGNPPICLLKRSTHAARLIPKLLVAM